MLAGPSAGFLREAATDANRSPRGIVAPRSATSLAIGESAGPEGDNRATSTPRSVTRKVSPSLTSRRYFERFCRNSLTPTESMCVTVAHGLSASANLFVDAEHRQ